MSKVPPDTIRHYNPTRRSQLNQAPALCLTHNIDAVVSPIASSPSGERRCTNRRCTKLVGRASCTSDWTIPTRTLHLSIPNPTCYRKEVGGPSILSVRGASVSAIAPVPLDYTLTYLSLVHVNPHSPSSQTARLRTGLRVPENFSESDFPFAGRSELARH
ncbi:hypothetical protein VTK73DRAFT_5644 [Phialemonium thermophilum]|uniref:Uncharacterized protein n=1 Tax=Phialemonium thermophilum TaxID=223376 RepID=A0ABR3WMP0_9PEZI